MVDRYELFFHQSNDPGFVIDLESKRLLEVNRAFTELTGWDPDEVAGGRYTSRDLIAPVDLEFFDAKVESRRETGRERYTIGITSRDSDHCQVEFSVAVVKLDGQSLVIGSLRDITAQKRLEKTLQNEITRQRNMTYKAAQASVRIGQVLEKLRSVPALARELLSAPSRSTLIETVVRELTAGDKFSYARVVVYIRDPDDADTHVRMVADSDMQRPEHVVTLAEVPLVARAMTEHELISDGLTYVIPVRSRREVAGALLIEFQEFEKNLFDENATIRRAQQDTVKTIGNLVGLGLENLDLYEKLQRQAFVDQLTSVNNRRYFEVQVDSVLQDPEAERGPVAVMLLDVDHFKGINDRLGHHAGDRVLVKVAELLQLYFSSALAICRFGGDEFAVLAPGGVTELADRAEQLRLAVEASGWELEGVEPTRLTVSIGVASFHRNLERRTWLVEVDQALYRAKQLGRNRVELAIPPPQEH